MSNALESISAFSVTESLKAPQFNITVGYKNNVINKNLFLSDFNEYNLDRYLYDIKKFGIETVWNNLCNYLCENKNSLPEFLNLDNLDYLYELALSTVNKEKKKSMGQYYTPDDVATLMSDWFDNCTGDTVCDVACGTGKLIRSYLKFIGYDRAKKLITGGKIYLYDVDAVAIKICKTILSLEYGLDISNHIKTINRDFLDRGITLPKNCKVIANPPYSRITEFGNEWQKTAVLTDTKEIYAAFMEKIFTQSKSAVIITPFSFISDKKFFALRKIMCSEGGGNVVSFDNVPGNIFNGKKHGIFNTNTANAVRAAITVFKRDGLNGFRISPLIRFKNEQRSKLFNASVLENLLPQKVQTVSEKNASFKKIDKNLTDLFEQWTEKSTYTVNDIISDDKTDYLIDMPNTCRYFTTASSEKLNRKGSMVSFVKNEEYFDFLYCFINSSFTYWWWRIFNGGITYPLGLFKEMPLPINLLSDEDKSFFFNMRKEMVSREKEYVVTKLNAGKLQENIKFPEEYRNKINQRILNILKSDVDVSILNSIHSNKFLEE